MRLRINKLFVVGVTCLTAALLLALFSASAFAQGPGAWGQGPYGGMMGGWGGTTGGSNGLGGMMGNGNGSGGMMGGYGGFGNVVPNGNQISLDQAAQNVNNYLVRFGNRDLATDEVLEFSNNFYANIKEQSTGMHAFELLVNKNSGAVSLEPGPNMMWNTKYGMMGRSGGMMGNWYGNTQSGIATVSPEQAKQYAQAYLDLYNKGTTVGDADPFYGYYTLETLKDDKTSGMLSVNAYTGQVWDHTWHGSFIRIKANP